MISTVTAVAAAKQNDFQPDSVSNRKRQSTIIRGLSSPTNKFAKVANSSTFQKICLLAVVLNAIWIGIDTDWNQTEEPGLVFVIMNNFFCAWFTAEILIRLLAYKKPMMFFTDQIQNLFDMALVLLMIIEIWMLPIFGASANLKSISSLRLLRLLRISRLFHLIPELATMVKSMAAAARSVTSTLVLELAAMYVFSIILTQWAKGAINSTTDNGFVSEYFGSILASMMTLLQLSLYDSAFSVIRGVQDLSALMVAVLFLFIVIGAFLILNILIGVIVEIVDSTKRKEEEKLLMENIGKVFDLIDEDGSGSISQDEYNQAAKPLLGRLGIDPMILENAFSIIDTDSSGTLERDEFLTMLGKMLKAPTAEDIHLTLTKLESILDDWNKDLTQLQSKMEATIDETVAEILFASRDVALAH